MLYLFPILGGLLRVSWGRLNLALTLCISNWIPRNWSEHIIKCCVHLCKLHWLIIIFASFIINWAEIVNYIFMTVKLVSCMCCNGLPYVFMMMHSPWIIGYNYIFATLFTLFTSFSCLHVTKNRFDHHKSIIVYHTCYRNQKKIIQDFCTSRYIIISQLFLLHNNLPKIYRVNATGKTI